MPGKIFINYRRDDDPSAAARVRDGLAAKLGTSNVFMDVDNLLVGQRFDQELASALAECDVLIAIIGPRWIDLLKARSADSQRDYVREEIAGALQRRILVIPVRVGREGQLAPMPRANELPDDIGSLILHQKYDLVHEHFSRDLGGLIHALKVIRHRQRPRQVAPIATIAWMVLAAIVGLTGGYLVMQHVVSPNTPASNQRASQDAIAPQTKDTRRVEDEIEHLALNNLSHETVECSAYYSWVSALLQKTPGQETLATQYSKNGEILFTRAIEMGKLIGQKQEAVAARLALSIEEMKNILDGNSANASILNQKHGIACKENAGNTEKRLSY